MLSYRASDDDVALAAGPLSSTRWEFLGSLVLVLSEDDSVLGWPSTAGSGSGSGSGSLSDVKIKLCSATLMTRDGGRCFGEDARRTATLSLLVVASAGTAQ
mmetsp:Transcript_4744/g.12156  ORF Transcript_4744/g.12156 Transcript_4744/m.12156 type:complete len:101 (-) Transcript_4744:1714-2016(-)